VSKRLAALGQPGAPAVDRLERLLVDASPSGKRFGAMLRELSSPDLLVLALLMRDGQAGQPSDSRLAAVRQVCDHLELAADSRRLVEFLVSDDLRMSTLAEAVSDPRAVETFAAYLNKMALFSSFTTEEHLKALCLLTRATIDAEGALTPERSDALGHFFDATYSHLTKAYGDELIDAATVRRTALNTSRPSSLLEQDLADFLTGLPRRYLTLFDPPSIYEHVRVCRNMGADEVHSFLRKTGGALWELTVATLDKPFLFSNVSGVLAYLDMDILSGQAMTSSKGVVLDVFRFHDHEGLLERSDPKPLLNDVIAGRVDVSKLFEGKDGGGHRSVVDQLSPVVAVDNRSSARFTIVEILARDAPGLLYRISRALSGSGCAIEMVVIATESGKAHDVFHVLKDGAKVAEAEESALTRALEAAVVS